MCFIPVELRVSYPWNCVFHPPGTVCFIPVELRVPTPWNCVSHPDGNVLEVYGRTRHVGNAPRLLPYAGGCIDLKRSCFQPSRHLQAYKR